MRNQRPLHLTNSCFWINEEQWSPGHIDKTTQVISPCDLDNSSSVLVIDIMERLQHRMQPSFKHCSFPLWGKTQCATQQERHFLCLPEGPSRGHNSKPSQHPHTLIKHQTLTLLTGVMHNSSPIFPKSFYFPMQISLYTTASKVFQILLFKTDIKLSYLCPEVLPAGARLSAEKWQERSQSERKVNTWDLPLYFLFSVFWLQWPSYYSACFLWALLECFT